MLARRQHGHHHIRRLYRFGNGARLGSPIGHSRGNRLFRQIEHIDVMARRHQVFGHWPAHISKSDKANRCHVRSS